MSEMSEIIFCLLTGIGFAMIIVPFSMGWNSMVTGKQEPSDFKEYAKIGNELLNKS